MMAFSLFVVIVIICIVIVRLGAVAFELTGMPSEQAIFQSLSCYTGTGFTTRESELVTRNRERRRIAIGIMILGNAGSISLIAAMASHIQNIFSNKTGFVGIPFTDTGFHVQPQLLVIIKILIVSVSLYIIYRLFMKSRISKIILDAIKSKMRQMKIIHPIVYEELVIGISGFDIIKLKITRNSPLNDKKISETKLRSEKNVQILAIERGDEVIPSPEPDTIVKEGDFLTFFGNPDIIEQLR